MGCTPRGSCNRTLLRRVFRRSFEGSLKEVRLRRALRGHLVRVSRTSVVPQGHRAAICRCHGVCVVTTPQNVFVYARSPWASSRSAVYGRLLSLTPLTLCLLHRDVPGPRRY